MEQEKKRVNNRESVNRKEALQQRWERLSSDVSDFIDLRLRDGASEPWYDFYLIDMICGLEKVPYLNHASEVNEFPAGIFAEVFFMKACNEVGLNCVPTIGREDMKGVDFEIGDGSETRFVDVTVNTSEEALKEKSKVWKVPTIFIPWGVKNSGNGYTPSYAEHYLATGKFEGSEFLNSILDFNYSNLHFLTKAVWSDGKDTDRKMRLNGIQYIKNLKGVLKMIRGACKASRL
ncbi:MAG: hypothetical protein ACOX0X_00295 [Candidatus Dojkabacteria bacterium]